MSGEEKSRLDELFKKGLDIPDPRFEYREEDWNDLEQMLEETKPRRGIVYWLPALSGVAAILLLFLGWWLFKPAAVNKQEQQQAVVKHLPVQHTDSIINNTAGNIKPMGDSNIINNQGRQAVKPAPSAPQSIAGGQKKLPVYANHAAVPYHAAGNSISVINKGSGINTNSGNLSPSIPASEYQRHEILVAYHTKGVMPSADAKLSGDTDINNKMGDKVAAFTAERNKQEMILAENELGKRNNKPALAYKKGPQFGLAMLVSPDINGVSSFQNAKVGTNIGLMLSVGVGKRLTFSTGAAYSKKPYMTDFSNYYTGYQFKVNPDEVYADCRVLDIPVNIDYKIYSKNRYSFSIGSGLSSYIMLKEKYTYDYAVSGTPGPTTFVVTNKNRHILGVLNLNATFSHQLNSKFSIAAQPYFKMPLTDIGNSRVKLQSAGVAVGLQWNINK